MQLFSDSVSGQELHVFDVPFHSWKLYFSVKV